VRALFQELAQQHLAHTGNDSSILGSIALLAIVGSGALLALSAWRRRRAA
jgi:hypothetical protein